MKRRRPRRRSAHGPRAATAAGEELPQIASPSATKSAPASARVPAGRDRVGVCDARRLEDFGPPGDPLGERQPATPDRLFARPRAAPRTSRSPPPFRLPSSPHRACARIRRRRSDPVSGVLIASTRAPRRRPRHGRRLRQVEPPTERRFQSTTRSRRPVAARRRGVTIASAWVSEPGARRTSAQAIGAAFERAGENLDEGVGVSGRQKRSDEIERAAGRVLRGQWHGRQKRIEKGDVADHCGQMAVEARLCRPADHRPRMCRARIRTRAEREGSRWPSYYSVKTQREGARLARRPPIAL